MTGGRCVQKQRDPSTVLITQKAFYFAQAPIKCKIWTMATGSFEHESVTNKGNLQFKNRLVRKYVDTVH